MANTTVQTGNSLPANCRSTKSTSSSLVGTIANGTTVDAVRCDGEWGTLQLNGTPCFMQHRMLVGIPTTNGDGLSVNKTAKLNTGAVNVRTGPGQSNSTTGSQLSQGTAVTIYAKSLNSSEGFYWYRINPTTESTARWVRGDFLAPGGSGGSPGGTGSFTTGNFVKLTGNNVNVRRTASSTEYGAIGYLRSGTKLICEGTSGSFVQVKWGGTNYGSAFISQDFMADAGAAPSAKKDKAIAMALSMADTGYTAASNFGLTADQWCVQWISFLMKAVGCTSYPNFSTQAQVSTAISFFGSNFGLRANKTPKAGDWVMYSKTGETYAHVGFIVEASGTNITTVEGNLSSTVKKVPSYNYNNGTGSFTVYGFATPTWA